MRMAGHGGTLSYWLGAAQLEAGDSCPVRFEYLSHRREQPLAPCSTPIEWWLITGICCSLCCVHADGETGVPSPGVEVGVDDWMDVSLGSVMWGTSCCPCSMPPPPPPPSPRRWWIQRNSRASGVAGVARMRLSTTTNCLSVSNSGFFLEVYSWSHFQRRVTTRQQ